MSQHDMVLENANGAAFRADLNNALAATVTLNAGATAPATTYAYMWWADTTTGLLKLRDATNSSWVTVGTLASAYLGHLVPADIGATVQGYDADTAKIDVAQNWTASQRSGLITDNDLSFDLSGAGNNYSCTPSAGGTLTFTNIAANGGKSGYIKLVNGSNYAIAAHANTKILTTDLTKISATGTYILSYVCDATNVYVTTSGNLA